MNKLLIALIMLLVVCPQSANAKPLGSFSANDKKYNLDFWSGNLTARSGDASINGEKRKEMGDFSQWLFKPEGKEPFAIIINNSTSKIINVREDFNATGPHIAAADGNYIVLDYDSDSVMKPFSLATASGEVLFKDEYIDGLKFNKNDDKIIFVYNSSSPFRNLEEMEKCHKQDKGIAIKVDTRYYDIDSRKLARIVPHGREIRCSK